MAQNVLQRAYSYTLIKPDSNKKVVVRRGQSIDHLDVSDQQYLSAKTIAPPSPDDSHVTVGRVPLFGPVVDAEVKGQASIEPVSNAVAEDAATTVEAATTEPVTVRVEVAAAAGLEATVTDTQIGAAAGGIDDSGGAAAVTKATTEVKRVAPKKRKPSSKKQ